MTARSRANVDYPLSRQAAVEQDARQPSPYTPIPCPTTDTSLRIFFPDDRRHIARLARRDPALEAALRRNGLTIPAIDDQDRR